MARVIIIRDVKDYQLPQKYRPRSKSSSYMSFQRATPNPRSIVENHELAYPLRSRFFTAKEKRHTVPEFTSRLDDQWHHHGDSVALRIGFRGYPEPVVSWFRDQQPIVSCMGTMIYVSEFSSELVIMDAQKIDSGFYTCRIENPLGVRDTNCQVYIGDNGRLQSKGHKTLIANSRLYRSALYKPNAYYSQFPLV
uniref:Ig-like domain-containing protein n=1 Tax=Panagrolaimus superbus TaxID=310955 RepID=A0A914YWR0_9BILA